jgi:putative tryptophan/tyrosine transport system substrate-binding protein
MPEVRRRELIVLLGGAAAAWPLAAGAQSSDLTRRVGVLMAGSENDAETQNRVAAFREGLKKLGWGTDRPVRIDYRWGVVGTERALAAAADLIALSPNVILAQGSPLSEALLKLTRTVPIVFVGASDPMSSGLVTSMARPAGNLTGFTNFEFLMGGKWLEILKEIAPDAERVLAVYSAGNIGSKGFLRSAQSAARAHQLVLIEAPVSTASEVERSVTAFAQKPRGGLMLLPSGSLATENRDLLITLTARYRIPATYPYRFMTTAGGLIAYDTDVAELYRRAASYIDRILRGENPGELPIQVPTKYRLTINLRTAQTLGLTVPPTLLARADEVIE